MEEEQEQNQTVTYVTTRRVTEAWKEASRANGAKAKDVVTSEEHRAKLRAAWEIRRQRAAEAKSATEADPAEAEPKKPGRPRTHPVVENTGEKRGRGRPKKEPVT